MQNNNNLGKIILDYNIDKELFNKTALKWAEAIFKTKKSQVRNFYDKVIELEEKAQKQEWSNVLPFVKMLNSKVAYGVTRRVVSPEFEKMINNCIEQVDSKEKLNIFKLFFEAVIGFYKGRD